MSRGSNRLQPCHGLMPRPISIAISQRSSEKVAASNLPSPCPSGEPPAEGAVAFSTNLSGWVGAMHRSQPPINRPQVFDSVSVRREGRGIQPPRRQERQGGRKDTVGYDMSGMDGHERISHLLQTLNLLGVLAVLLWLRPLLLGHFSDLPFQQNKAVAEISSDAAASPPPIPSLRLCASARVPPHPDPKTFR